MGAILLQENNKVSAEAQAHKNIESDINYNYLYHIDIIILDDNKEKIELFKRAFESELENTYDIEIQNGMTFIHWNKVNKLDEYNLLHDIINPQKRTKILNSHYYPILQGCMNTRKGKAMFKTFLILVESGCSSTIIMGRLITKLCPKGENVIKWHTQVVKLNTNIKFKIDFNLPGLSATKTLTWNCRMDDSSKIRYDMILCRYLLTALELNI